MEIGEVLILLAMVTVFAIIVAAIYYGARAGARARARANRNDR